VVELKLGLFERALADFSTDLGKKQNDQFALFGRGIAKLRSGDRPGGEADIAAAKAIWAYVVNIYADYGITE
jgi:hypothetical protein